MSYSPFEVSRAIGANIGGAFKAAREESALDNILQQAAKTQDPNQFHDIMGQILKNVAPEKQQAALQIIEGKMKGIKDRELEQKRIEDANKNGYSPYAPPQVQAAQVKESSKQKRLESIFGKGNIGQSQVSGANAPQIPGSNWLQSKSLDELKLLAGHPDREVAEPAKIELQSRIAENKLDREDLREKRKEVTALKQDIANKAAIAQQSLLNKQQQLDIIDRGDINDPTVATVLESLPFQLGQRFLSNDTVQYKAALVDDYRDLKNIFVGQTRNAELDILSKKIADTYYTDEQKKAIIKARMNSLEVDAVKADIAQEIEEKFPNIGVLEFSRKLNDEVKKRTEMIANKVIDDLVNIQKEAETRKSRPLDVRNPEDAQIMSQIMLEAKGNVQKAYKIAESKGYKVLK